VIPGGTAFCVSAKQDITAFKSFGFGQNETEYIEFAFLRPRRLTGSSDAQVERHEWRLLGVDIEEFTTQYLTLTQFDTLRNRQSFTLLGATNESKAWKWEPQALFSISFIGNLGFIELCFSERFVQKTWKNLHGEKRN